jgi:hypothetical protein
VTPARVFFVCVGLLVSTAFSAQIATQTAGNRFYITSPGAALVGEGLASGLPTGAEAAGFEVVPPPGLRNVPNEAQATTAAWIDSNAWRFQRGLRKAHYSKLPPGSASLAAAEAFTFDVDAILNPEPAEVAEVGRMLRFLKAQPPLSLPAMANIGVVDDGSAAMAEVLNMLTRRNLLYRVVPRPDRQLDLTVQLGTRDFPKEAVANPSDFAARVREKLGDDRRLVRLYGTSSAIAHLTGDGRRARLNLLSYGRGRGGQQSVRVRVLGRYQPSRFAAYGAAADASLADVQNPGKATEFLLPTFSTIAIVDLQAR